MKFNPIVGTYIISTDSYEEFRNDFIICAQRISAMNDCAKPYAMMSIDVYDKITELIEEHEHKKFPLTHTFNILFGYRVMLIPVVENYLQFGFDDCKIMNRHCRMVSK